MNQPLDAPQPSFNDIEVSAAGWFFFFAAAWELVFNRIFTALGLYTHAGAEGGLALLAESGRFAMNSVGIMGLILVCILLPRLAADPRLARLPGRLILMLTSPLFLPVTCVAIFRPVSTWLVVLSYLIAMSAMLYLTALVVTHRFDGGSRRILIALALIEVIAAFELTAGVSGLSESVSQRAHLAAEALYLAVPIFAFLLFVQGRFAAMRRKPPVLPILFALVTTGFAALIALPRTGDYYLPLLLLSVKSLGITLSMPGGVYPYLVALFFGSLLVGCLIFPSAAIRPNATLRKQGFGLACILMGGLQPTHPYLSIMVIAGFLYLTQSMVETIRPNQPKISDEQNTTSKKIDESKTSSLTDAPGRAT